jgi:hypothetical protein
MRPVSAPRPNLIRQLTVRRPTQNIRIAGGYTRCETVLWSFLKSLDRISKDWLNRGKVPSVQRRRLAELPGAISWT